MKTHDLQYGLEELQNKIKLDVDCKPTKRVGFHVAF